MQYLNIQKFYKFLERHNNDQATSFWQKQVSRNNFLWRSAFPINMQKLKHVHKKKGIYDPESNYKFGITWISFMLLILIPTVFYK